MWARPNRVKGASMTSWFRFLPAALAAGLLLVAPQTIRADRNHSRGGWDSPGWRNGSEREWRKADKERQKEMRKAWRQREKDRRKAAREWEKDRREWDRDWDRDEREWDRDWEQDRRDGRRYRRNRD